MHIRKRVQHRRKSVLYVRTSDVAPHLAHRHCAPRTGTAHTSITQHIPHRIIYTNTHPIRDSVQSQRETFPHTQHT